MSDCSAHTLLCRLGAVWLMRLGCVAVNVECEMHGVGIADAVGFGITKGRKRGIVIEAKTSRGDFFRDAKKWHRRRLSEGWSEHYYIVPDGLVGPSEIPESWGLLVVTESNIPRIAKRAPYVEPDAAWWAHHVVTITKMQTNRWARDVLGAVGFLPGIFVPGLPEEFASALAPLAHTTRSGPSHGEQLAFREQGGVL